MRISDWSSDVCSSDLIAVQIAVADAPAFGRTDQRKIDAKVQRPLPDSGGCKHPALWGCAFSLDLFARRLFRRGCLGRIRFFFGFGPRRFPVRFEQIGRASCRESVGKYV